MLYRHLAAHARHRPDAPALVQGHGRTRRVTTFGDLDAQARAVDKRLMEAGLGPGNRVLVAARGRSAALYALVAGLLRAGVAAVVPDVTRGLRGAVDAWRRLPADAVVVPDALAALLPRRLAGRRVWGLNALTAPGPSPADDGGTGDERAETGPNTPALFTFTSGSTGRPRVVVRTHGVLGAQFDALRPLLGDAPGDVGLATLPVFALASLAAGATVVLPDQPLRRVSKVDAPALAAQIGAERVTRIVASPALLACLVADAPAGALAGLRHIHTGGGPVFPDLLDALARAAPHAHLAAVYGSTEAEPIAAWTVPDAAAAAHEGALGLLAGALVAPARVALVRPGALPEHALGANEHVSDDAWNAALAAPPPPGARWGEAGEIAVAGPHVVPNYHDDPDADRRAKRTTGPPEAPVRWHLTGDLGRFDDSGRLWLLGRVSAWRPGAPFPLAVEAALRRVPGVGRAALVPVPGGHGGERLVVAYDGPARPDDVRAALPPGRVDAVISLPRLPLDRRHDAKIDLPALRKMLLRRTAFVETDP